MDRRTRRATTLFIIMIAGFVMFIATFAPYALGVLGWAFAAEVGVSTSMIGILTAIIFASAGVASFFVGMIADRVDAAWLSFWQVVLAAAVFAIFAFVQSQTMLIVACILIGAVMSLCNPLTNRLVALYLPPAVHDIAISWKAVGPQLGALFAGIAFGGIAEIFNWRAIIMALAILMVAFGAYSLFALRTRRYYRPGADGVAGDGAEAPAAAEAVDGAAADHPAAAVDGDPADARRTQPIAWWLIPFAFFSGGAIASIGAYIPLYASQSMGMTLTAAGIAGALIAGVSIVARFLWVALLRIFDFVTVLVLAGVTAAASTVVLAVAPQFGPTVFWIAIVLTGATALGAAPVMQIVLVQSASKHQVGFISAMVGVGMYAGFTFQPLGIAYLIDNVGFDVSWYAMATSALISALLIVVYAMVHGRPGKPRARTRETVTAAP